MIKRIASLSLVTLVDIHTLRNLNLFQSPFW